MRVKSRSRALVHRIVLLFVIGVGAVTGLGLADAADQPRHVELDLLRRVRVIAVAGSAEGAPTTGTANEAAETARQFARHLKETRRLHVVDGERVAAAMAKLQLRTPRDLFTREPGIGLRLDVERASRLASEAGADSLLVPIWDSVPAVKKAPGETAAPSLRMRVMLVYRVRKQIIWEDTQLARTPLLPGVGGLAATADGVAGPLIERFIGQWRIAGERG
jgi:hypothetical protein